MLTPKQLVWGLGLIIAIAGVSSMASPEAAAQRPSPRLVTATLSEIEVDGAVLAGTTVSGQILIDAEVISYQDGGDQSLKTRPGRIKLHPVVFQVAQWAPNHALHAMWQDTATGKQNRKAFTVTWKDPKTGKASSQVKMPDSWVSAVSVAGDGTVTVTVQPGAITFE